MSNKYLDLLNSMEDQTSSKETVLLVDALNLFFRNFTTLNFINPSGNHIGGLVGFLRSLGSMIKETGPDKIYIVFDGTGSSNSRKNLIPEYKQNRVGRKISNNNIYTSYEEESEGKVNQIGRLIHYLKCLPVHIISVDGCEADDVIAYLAKYFKDRGKQSVIASSDKDYLQLIEDDLMVFRPAEREFFNQEKVLAKFGVLAENYILYKTILGDNSDQISGIKGIGEKTLNKIYPELKERKLTLDDLIEISSTRYKDKSTGKHHSQIILQSDKLEKNYKVMDLSNPLIQPEQIQELIEFVNLNEVEYLPNEFIKMSEEDQFGQLIKMPRAWLDTNFKNLKK